MKRSISVERVYNLGEYKSLRITDRVDDIPEELVFDQSFMGKVKSLLLAEIERTYYEYSALSQVTRDGHNTDGERLAYLENYTNSLNSEITLELIKIKEE